MTKRNADLTRVFLVVYWLSLFTLTLGEVRGRMRRSDDSDPLVAVVSMLTQKVDLLTSQLAAQDLYCKNQINQLKSRVAATEQPVAFTAYFGHAGTNIHALSVGQTVKFDTALFNAGSAYNPTTGVFTAPSPGTYVVFVHILHSFLPGADEEGPIEVHIYADHTRLLRVGACCKNMNSASNMVTVRLTQGQAVHVQVFKGTMLLGGIHSSFSGYKLNPL
ncbi:complement C1q subcomponent subunit B-like [Littorina saxatilis]|uniref:C1q domain-containing protein n=1 Tax=Littorina saxatilis TaxID=31220 RepID=A0AAN9BAV1_9CAEN